MHEKSNSGIAKQTESRPRDYRVERTANQRTRITTRRGATFVEELPIKRDEQGRGVLTVEELPDGMLWQPRVVENGGSVLRSSVEINVSHPFYQKAYTLCKGNPNAIKALDYLLWSLADAEYSSKDERSRQNYEDLRRDVSRNLRALADELPQPRA